MITKFSKNNFNKSNNEYYIFKEFENLFVLASAEATTPLCKK